MQYFCEKRLDSTALEKHKHSHFFVVFKEADVKGIIVHTRWAGKREGGRGRGGSHF